MADVSIFSLRSRGSCMLSCVAVCVFGDARFSHHGRGECGVFRAVPRFVSCGVRNGVAGGLDVFECPFNASGRYCLARRVFSFRCVRSVCFACSNSSRSGCRLLGVLGCGWWLLIVVGAAVLSSLCHKRMVLFAALGLAAGSLLFMGIMYLAPFAKPCALVVVAGLSAGFSLSTHHLIRRNIPFVSSSESKERSCVSWKSSAAVLGNSICVGFMLYCVSLAIDMEWRYGVVGFAAIAAAVVMAMDVYHGERLNEETQLRLFLPGVVCGFFPMLFFGSWGILLGCVALVLVFSMQFITNLGAVAENVYLFKLSAVRSFSAWRLWNLVGMMAGYVAGFAAFGFIGRDGGDASTSVLFGLLALFVVLATFFYQNRYPSLMSERIEDKREESQRGKWMAKCERFAISNDLSPREKEILVMLAKGHDTDFIQEKLFISKSTIKSHTYNIYKKAGVHSRKELMNLIKEVELPSDPPKRSKSIKGVSVHA